MRVLMTGAGGGIGSKLRKLLPPIYPDLVLSDIKSPEGLAAGETFIQADLTDYAAVERVVKGVDGIIHLGGFSVEGPWETILQSNIIGTYNLFEAARASGVKRIVFASSNHVVGFYPRSCEIGIDTLPLPDSRYGVSKAFGESLGAMYAHKHGLGVFCIRIGNAGVQPENERQLSIWLKPEDLVSLIRIGLEREGIVYEVVYGVSDNARTFWDNSRAVELGYKPEGKAENFVERAMKAQQALPPDEVGDYFQGGPFCSMEFSAPFASGRSTMDPKTKG
jgi:uronate dehydrogenase